MFPLPEQRQLAASTSIRAFEILCLNCEDRGLVFVHSNNPEQKLEEVYYDRDPSWQHELVSGFLSNVVAVDLCQLASRTPCGMLSISLLVAVSTLCSYVDIAFVM